MPSGGFASAGVFPEFMHAQPAAAHCAVELVVVHQDLLIHESEGADERGGGGSLATSDPIDSTD